jgi:hypothetical protein
MNELSPRARALIESAMLHEEGPSVAELRRVRRSVLSGLAASGAVAGATSTTLLAKAAAALGGTAGQVTAYAMAGALAAGGTLAVHQTVVGQTSRGAAMVTISNGAGTKSMAHVSRAAEMPFPPPAALTVDSPSNVAAAAVGATSVERTTVGSPILAQPSVGSSPALPSSGTQGMAGSLGTAPSARFDPGSRTDFDARGSRPPGSPAPDHDVSSPEHAFAAPSGGVESAPGKAGLARPSGNLAEQLAYLRAMRTELHAGNAARALELSRESEAIFAGSALEAEARAARITALCRIGRSVEARSAIERFRRSFPNSALLRNVEHGCTIDGREGTGH